MKKIFFVLSLMLFLTSCSVTLPVNASLVIKLETKLECLKQQVILILFGLDKTPVSKKAKTSGNNKNLDS